MNINMKYLPGNDRVFGVMFSDKELYKALLKAIFNKEFELLENTPVTQAQKTEDARRNLIKLDTFAITDNGIFSIDMQKKDNIKNRILARSMYYTCRLISTQKVENMKYEKLQPVAVVFVMQEAKNPKSNGIRYASMHWEDTLEKFTGLIRVAMVYIPTIVKKGTQNSDLSIFAEFFNIQNQQQADNFESEFGKTDLGVKLMNNYGAAILDWEALERIDKQGYYSQKDYEIMLEEEITETKTNIAKSLFKLKMPIEQISIATEIPIEKLKEMLE